MHFHDLSLRKNFQNSGCVMASRLIHETDTAPHVPIAYIVKNSCFGVEGP